MTTLTDDQARELWADAMDAYVRAQVAPLIAEMRAANAKLAENTVALSAIADR